MSEHVITTSWQEVLLLSVCDINPGVVMPEANSGNVYDFVPMDAIDEHNGILSYSEQKPFTEVRQGKTRFQVGDILFAKITPSTENGKVALVERLNTSIGFGSTEFFVFRPGNELLSTFLWFWLRSSSIRNAAVSAMTGSSGRLRVPSSFWDTLQIPLPPLPVQRAIVTILSKADAIRRKRVQARQLADELLAAQFYDLYMSSGGQQKIRTTLPLGQLLLENPRYGSSERADTYGSGIPILRIPNILSGKIDVTHMKYVNLEKKIVERLKVLPGDILLVRSNGNPEYVGRCAVVDNLSREYVFASYLIRLRPDQTLVNPVYLDAFLKTPDARSQMMSRVVTSAGNYNINAETLKAIRVPLPALEDQEKFDFFSTKTKDIISKELRAEEEANNQFSTLLARAFSGELTAEWEREHADLIAAEVARLERRPRLALLALLAARQAVRTEPVGITSLMKYAFLAQMQGQALSQPAGRLYRFVPYHFGPFAQELYADLEVLAAEGWVTVERPEGDLTTPERTDIRLNPQRAAAVTAAVAELSADERADLTQVIAQYGDLAHNALLEAVYSQYPAYARKSKLRRRRS